MSETTAATTVEDRRSALALALVVLVVVVAHVATLYAPNTWVNRDGRFYTNMNVTLVEDLGLEQDEFAASWYQGNLGWNRNLPGSFSNIALGRDGTHYPMHPWLMPVLSTPLFFAFGIVGTLVFNVAMFGVIAAMLFVFARRYTAAAPAALAVSTLLLGTAIHEYAYDYHVDILLLALLSSALAALVTRRGVLLGALVGLVLVIKPTSLMLLPALLLLLYERRDLETTKRAVLGGAVVLGAVALVNTYMFGRPWLFGYMRVLTVENGEPVLASSGEAFTTPLDAGIERTWSGHWGLRHRMTIMALALPGLLWLLKSRWHYAVGALIAAVTSFFVFAQYQYEGDRFHWPAIALLVPALGETLRLTGAGLAAAGRRLRSLEPDGARTVTPLLAAAMAVLSVLATLPFGPTLEERVGRAPYVTGALAIGEGELDLRDRVGVHAISVGPERSPVSRTRFGQWMARTSPPALLVAAPFTAVGGSAGLLLLHLLAAALAVFYGARSLGTVTSPPIAAAALAAPFLLPMVRDAVVPGGPALLAAALAMAAIATALDRRWAVAGALSAAAAWMADAPLLIVIGVLAIAHLDGRRALLRSGVAAAATLAVWGLGHLLLIGRPFASPEDFVLVDMIGGTDTIAVDVPTVGSALETVMASPAPGRALVVLLAVAPLGVLAALAASRRTGVLLLAALGSAFVPSVLAPALLAPAAPLVVVLGVMGVAAVAGAVAAPLRRTVERASVRSRWIGVGAAVLVLLAVGGIDRAARAGSPFRIDSTEGVRRADVLLADRIPCDFLPWEHMTWECSHYDRGHFNQAGLALPEGIHAGGRQTGLFLVPTGQRGQSRSVTWPDVSAEDWLVLEWAVPDRLRPGARFEVLIDGETKEQVLATREHAGSVHRLVLDTSDVAGRTVDLGVRVSGAAGTGLAFGGGFSPDRPE